MCCRRIGIIDVTLGCCCLLPAVCMVEGGTGSVYIPLSIGDPTIHVDELREFDGMQTYSEPGASALVVVFDEFISKLDDSSRTWDEFETTHAVGVKDTVDQLFVPDGNDQVIGTLTGRERQGLRLVVPGDTVKFHLVTD